MLSIRKIKRLSLIVLSSVMVLVVLHYIYRALICDTFVVTGESMEPVLHSGERVWVNKLRMGARIYTDYDFTKPTLSSFRLPGFSKVKAGDLVVANYPYARSKDTISFRINYVYLKRCYAVPGDTLRIKNGCYVNPQTGGQIGDLKYQRILSETSDSILTKTGVVLKAMQVNQKLGWSIRDFGPLPVPKKGDTVEITADNHRTWRRPILYETGKCLRECGGQVFLGQTPLHEYSFKGNWYFLGGDNVLNSHDSRYFGLVPEEYIVGVVVSEVERNL